ncbi:FAD-binding oxidoreductase [Polaribacter sp. ALD11]|nr:FAD-binding oxidoreductase [Polaribacter sp. ALD11]
MAISSSLFILIAAITGIVLAFEPISDKLHSFDTINLNDVSISETVTVLQQKYDEVLTIEIDENDFVSADVITLEGESQTFYINPKTGDKIGEIIEKKPIFEFATNLHRSLFLKSTGRFIIGFVSLLLLLIAVTGVLLIAKRQGGFSKFFSKIVKEDFNQYYHIIIGRYALIPIIIITITGVYLSLEKFSLLPKETATHQNIEQKNVISKINVADFKVFKETSLSDVEKIEFPFSTDEEDYFFAKFTDKEIAIHQFTGQIVSQKKQSLASLGSYYSLILHTGKGSIIWSLILLLACFAILFFIFSGFSMTLKRKKATTLIKNKFNKDKAEYIILVGSETGSTFNFATIFYKALLAIGKTAYITQLNEYTTYNKAKNIVIFTATYGEGEAPVNATKFLKKINKIPQNNILKFSVVGFGSTDYKEFCKYAILVQAHLQLHENFIPISPVFKINNQSFSEFNNWTKEWSTFNKIALKIEKESLLVSEKNEQVFTVLNKTEVNIDDTFLIQLKPNNKTTFVSGDLLSITPKDETRSRLYSVGKTDNTLLLSIKKHEFGLCSTYFNSLNTNDEIVAKIQTNEKFHFPKKTKEVILIANGTGIAPFLGMIHKKSSKTKIHLFWGARTKKSFEIYKDTIEKAIENKSLTTFCTAYSQEQKEKIYVQDIILNHPKLIAKTLDKGNCIMICGSIHMQKGVLKSLEEITISYLKTPLEKFEKNNQIKTDCY